MIKKLDLFVVKAFCLLFGGTFCVCLFVFLMQLTWRYMEELIGKGLSLDVLAKFYSYAALTLIPDSLPLAILLAALMTFGNFGERLELLSMKAAGIPLTTIFRPLIILCLLFTGVSFYFQNVTSPHAQTKLILLTYSMKQKSPELEIPEGVFYNNIPGFNIYVQKKDVETGMLYGVMIYRNGETTNNTEIVLADSARMQTTADKGHLKLTLYNGERFRNMQTPRGTMANANVPYMRESFIKEVDMLTFDNEFNMASDDLMDGDPRSMNMLEIRENVDKINARYDSIGQTYLNDLNVRLQRGEDATPTTAARQDELPERQTLETGTTGWVRTTTHADGSTTMEQVSADNEVVATTTIAPKAGASKKTTAKAKENTKAKEAAKPTVVNLDSILNSLPVDKRTALISNALTRVQSARSDLEFKAMNTQDADAAIRRHWIEWNKKITHSISCIIFFFIGASLGAIVGKGGLGVPVIISVIFYILYFIVDITGTKMVRAGEWAIWFGMWISTFMLLPVAVFLTYKANSDSAIFNTDGYRLFFAKIMGLRASRHLVRKEFSLADPDLEAAKTEMDAISADCATYLKEHKLLKWPSYIRLFFKNEDDTAIEALSERLERHIEHMADSRDARLVARLNNYPVLSERAHTRPFHNYKWNRVCGVFFPLGIVLYIRIIRFRVRLYRDLKQIQRTNEKLKEYIEKS
jgi:lipopolysaccharide export system permease protein